MSANIFMSAAECLPEQSGFNQVLVGAILISEDSLSQEELFSADFNLYRVIDLCLARSITLYNIIFLMDYEVKQKNQLNKKCIWQIGLCLLGTIYHAFYLLFLHYFTVQTGKDRFPPLVAYFSKTVVKVLVKHFAT